MQREVPSQKPQQDMNKDMNMPSKESSESNIESNMMGGQSIPLDNPDMKLNKGEGQHAIPLHDQKWVNVHHHE